MVALLLAACVPQTVRSPLPSLSPQEVAVAQTRQTTHEAAVRAAPSWSLQGRVAVSNGRNGGSGRIDWRQDADRYEVALSAPITRQSWRLSGDRVAAQLEGLEGGTRSGADPQQLLREATGWEIPVAALSSWVRGARADEAVFGPATLAFGTDLRLARIEQGGWTIDYAAWQPTSEAAALPLRLNAQRGEAKVRLVVDGWNGVETP
ncbi:lipoprotein insertase outer membrane protein LolB [Luteimonas sp. SX5]|uniref:Outer-membrane lipoprotein LolB n=1 Tax=Luteimonas galliterrae TaxID=2940486 RepID=A0ABT0MHQ0_9GAMM|nr:lipoprotein insertase outer membrane protein LolB [Luteimonas galliterrae]